MPRRAVPNTSKSLLLALWAHFGLTQAELAGFTGVSREQVAAAEAGRRELAEAPRHRLWVLAGALPPPDGQGPLSFRGTETDFRVDNTSDTAKGPSDEFGGLNTYITAITPVVAGMAAGKERTALADELRRKTDRRDTLVSRQGNVGPEKLMVRELEQALLDPQVPIMQDLIAQVTAHRATLTA